MSLEYSDATVSGNTISGNTANEQGGGLSLQNSDVLLTNNVVADNRANDGGGLYVQASVARLLHTTIARNQAGSAVSVTEHLYGGPSTVVMTNTILVSHTVGITVTAGSTVTLEATLWGTDTWANETDWAGDGTIITGSVNIWDDPAFVNPDFGDYHIGPGSAALDVGVDAAVHTDIDRQPRPYLAPDLGADEYWPPGVLKHVYLPLILRNGP